MDTAGVVALRAEASVTSAAVSAAPDPVLQRIARFWDARAREDALRYSVPGGHRQDPADFDGAGDAVLVALEALVGYAPGPTDVALDLGCGAGRLTAALAARVEAVIACDVSPGMLEVARGRIGATPGVQLRVAHAADLRGIGPGEADTAVVLGVLPHLPTVDLVADALAELGRVLRPGGSVVFDVRSAPEPLLLPGEHALPAHVRDHPLWRGCVVDLETLAAVAGQEGLVIERIAGSETPRSVVRASREAF
jgi:SAM-dependent methyltransferase